MNGPPVLFSDMPQADRDALAALIGGELAAVNLGNVSDVDAATVDLLSDRIRSNVTITVPGDYATVQAALDSLAYKRISPTATVTISVSGHLSHTSVITALHPEADRIVIQGQSLLSRSFASVTSVSGSAGAYTVRLPLNSYSDVSVGDFVAITGTSGNELAKLMHGGWPITAVSPGSYIEFTCTAKRGTIPTGAISGTATIYRTVLSFTGCSGLDAEELGGINQIALKSDGTASTFGLTDEHTGDVVTTDSCWHGWGDDGISRRGGRILGTRVFITGCGNNGANMREVGSSARFTDSWFNGNGTLANYSVGGACGLMGQGGGYETFGSSGAWGNYGEGLKQRTNGRAYAQGFSAGCNWNDYRTGQGGWVDISSSTSYRPDNSSWECEGGGMVANAARSDLAQGNALTHRGVGEFVGSAIIIRNPVFNGVSSFGYGGFVDIRNNDIDGAGASSVILTGYSVRVIITGAVGDTNSVLVGGGTAHNTTDANGNRVIN